MTGRVALLLVFAAGCSQTGPSPQEQPQASRYAIIDTLMESDDYHCFSATDIDYVTGKLSVLDGPARQVLCFGSNDSLLFSFGQAGSGPGELGWPVSMAMTEQGGFLLSDFTGIIEYDSTGYWVQNVINYSNNPMLNLCTLDDSTFMAYKHDIIIDNERRLIIWSISSYCDGCMRTCYTADTLFVDELSSSEVLNGSLFSSVFSCGRGRAFLFNCNERQYEISCMDASAHCLYSIVRDVEIPDKSESQLRWESQEMEGWLAGTGESDVIEYVYEPRPWREPVKEMWVTDDGEELWVQRGDLDGFMFDIYSTTDGSLIRTSEARIDTSGLWDVSFFIADPDRVYAILEDDDTNQMLVRLAPAE
jgi:hypothetical protein